MSLLKKAHMWLSSNTIIFQGLGDYFSMLRGWTGENPSTYAKWHDGGAETVSVLYSYASAPPHLRFHPFEQQSVADSH